MKITESTLQAIIMEWAMEEKHHALILPNSNNFFHWEADLITVTQAGLAHEFEIKLNIADFKRDAEKRKHRWIGDPTYAPAYFWYVTHDFEIEPPQKAGWIKIRFDDESCRWKINVVKNAPRLNKWRIDERRQLEIGRLLSFRLKNFYRKYMYLNQVEAEEAVTE